MSSDTSEVASGSANRSPGFWQSFALAVQELFSWRVPTPRVVYQWNVITLTSLMAGTVFAAVVLVQTWTCYLSADGYVDYVEGLVLYHQAQAAAGENIYDASFRAAPPYSIPLYGPVWYYLISPFLGAQPTLLPGRAAALLCMLGLAGSGCYVLRKQFQAAWVIAIPISIVWMTTVGTLQFGINNRVDALGCLLGALAVIACTTRFRANWCVVVLLLLGAAFTKATAAVAPGLTVFLYLLLERRWREAFTISIVTGLSAFGILLLGDLLSQGNFSQCLVFSNANPLKLSQALSLIENVCKQPVLPVGFVVAVVLLANRRARPFAIFGVLSFALAMFSAGKVGSNTNYFIEPSWATAMCLGIALTHCRGHIRAPVAYALAAFLVIHSTARATSHVRHVNDTLAGWPMVQHAVEHYGAQGLLLTMEVGAQVLAGQSPYIADAHIITRLTEAGRFDQQPIVEDLREQKLPALLLGKDIALEHVGHTNWTNEIRLAVAQYYRPQEKLGEVTLYVPRQVPLAADGLRCRSPEDSAEDELVQVSKFHPNGYLAEVSEFRAGKLHGKHEEWDANGRKWCELQYNSGRLDGPQRYFHENGQLAQELTYTRGIRHGEERCYSVSGACRQSVAWVEGVPHPPAAPVDAMRGELPAERVHVSARPDSGAHKLRR